MIDLHTHSTASDGTLSPRDLVRHARERGITTLGLVDHDTVSGLAEAFHEASALGVEFIPGVEISAAYEPGTLHMLGYYIDSSSARLESGLASLRKERSRRNHLIIDKLADLGIHLDWKDVEQFSFGETTGRTHIARAIVAKGLAPSLDEALMRYLLKDAPAFVDKERMSPQDTISLILEAGGLPVLAHPMTLGLKADTLSELVGEFRAAGLIGLETYYTHHSAQDTAFIESLAQKHGLLVTGGTDFHGGVHPNVKLGTGLGNLSVPDEVAIRLKQAGRKVITPSPIKE